MTESVLDPSVPVYPVHDTPEVDALRLEKNEARTRWRRTHVQLDTAARHVEDARDTDIAIEAQDEHLAALIEWKSREASFVAARLGFRSEPLPPRRTSS